MSRIKITLAAILCLPFMACASTLPVATRLPDVATPNAEPVVMQDYTWKVYKNAEIQSLAEELKKNPKKHVIMFALTEKGYQRLNNDFVELDRYIREQKAIIVYLKKEISDRAPVATAK